MLDRTTSTTPHGSGGADPRTSDTPGGLRRNGAKDRSPQCAVKPFTGNAIAARQEEAGR